MKKKLLLFGLVTFALSSCSLFFPYRVVSDEFKNTKKAIFAIDLPPTEYNTTITSSAITFENALSDSAETINAYFVLHRSSSSFKLDKKCFMKASGKSYEINIENAETESRSALNTTTTSTTVKDSAKIKTKLETISNTDNWYEDRFIVRLTPQMIESVRNTDELLFRFYSGPEQATFKFSGWTMKRVKQVFDK